MNKKILLGLASFGAFFGVMNITKAECKKIDMNYECVEVESVEAGSNSTDINVIVGDVATPIYSVDIEWDDLKFDYIYDYIENRYLFVPEKTCQQYSVDQEKYGQMVFDDSKDEYGNSFYLYTNDSCTERALGGGGNYEPGKIYYAIYPKRNGISIVDKSVGGAIAPSVTFKPEAKYSKINGKFKYLAPICRYVTEDEWNNKYAIPTIYSDSECSEKVDKDSTQFEANKYYTNDLTYKDLAGSSLPDEARAMLESYGYTYDLLFNVENDSDLNLKPVSEEKIGTITVSISAKDN